MKKLAIAAAIVAASASSSYAEGPKDGMHPKGHGRFIEAIDGNKDGKVDAAEFAAGATARAGKRFDAIDTEGKGSISRAQFIAAAEAEAEKRFDRFDANGDGILDRSDRESHRDWKGGPESSPSPGDLPE